MAETRFVKVATSVGVARKIAALMVECDRVAEHAVFPWSDQLDAQRRLLQHPTLRALVALTTRLVEENPDLTPLVAPALGDLLEAHPDYAPFHARVLDPCGAGLGAPLRGVG